MSEVSEDCLLATREARVSPEVCHDMFLEQVFLFGNGSCFNFNMVHGCRKML